MKYSTWKVHIDTATERVFHGHMTGKLISGAPTGSFVMMRPDEFEKLVEATAEYLASENSGFSEPVGQLPPPSSNPSKVNVVYKDESALWLDVNLKTGEIEKMWSIFDPSGMEVSEVLDYDSGVPVEESVAFEATAIAETTGTWPETIELSMRKGSTRIKPEGWPEMDQPEYEEHLLPFSFF